jgi:hypothetical protein
MKLNGEPKVRIYGQNFEDEGKYRPELCGASLSYQLLGELGYRHIKWQGYAIC